MNEHDATGARMLSMLADMAIITQLVSAASSRAIGHALGQSEYWLLFHMVRRGDGDTPSRLAKVFQVSKPSMTATIARLAAKGCVQVVDDTADGRSKRVLLTDAGRAAHDGARARLATAQQKLFAGFDVNGLLQHAGAIALLRQYLDAQRNGIDGLA
jgi:DNA-binding MarR family transcriptional regulator